MLEAVQRRLDENPQAMRQRRETVEHPFGTIKSWMGATHFLMRRLTAYISPRRSRLSPAMHSTASATLRNST